MDVAEQKLLEHHEYMVKNDTYVIPLEKVKDGLDNRAMIFHKNDKFGRPLCYHIMKNN